MRKENLMGASALVLYCAGFSRAIGSGKLIAAILVAVLALPMSSLAHHIGNNDSIGTVGGSTVGSGNIGTFGSSGGFSGRIFTSGSSGVGSGSITTSGDSGVTSGTIGTRGGSGVNSGSIRTSGSSGDFSGSIGTFGAGGGFSGSIGTSGGSGEDSGGITTDSSGTDHATAGSIMTNGEMRAGSFTTETGICGSADNAQCGDFVEGADGMKVRRTGTNFRDNRDYERQARTHIRAESIGADDIAEGAVGSDEIADASVAMGDLSLAVRNSISGAQTSAQNAETQATSALSSTQENQQAIMSESNTRQTTNGWFDTRVTALENHDIQGDINRAIAAQTEEMDGRFADVDASLAKIEGAIDRLDEGIAMSHAMAMIGAPTKKSFGITAATGFYQDKSAAAIGLGFRPTDSVLIKAGVSYGFDSKEVGGGLGVMLEF